MMDRTQSMTYMIQNTALQRWDVIEQAVQQFVNDPNVQTMAPRVGLAFFGATGNPDDPTECDPATYAKPKIEFEPIATSGPKILQAVVDERALLGGQTPWMPSLEGALMHAQDWQTANPTRLTVVVFVTDGYPTECDQDISHIQKWWGNTMREFRVPTTTGASPAFARILSASRWTSSISTPLRRLVALHAP